MIIPGVSPGNISEALKTFGLKHHDTPAFTSWEHKGTQRYAIVYNCKLYPPKMVISLAAGLKRSEFNGGKQTNSYLTERGYRIINLLKDDVGEAVTASMSDI